MTSTPGTRLPALPGGHQFTIEERLARILDASDPLGPCRRDFALPAGPAGEPLVYLLGNSLGPLPLSAREETERVLAEWSGLGVEAWTDASVPWMSYQESCRDALARLAGARPGEIVTMNSLTINLHLLLASFYRPSGRRVGVLMESKSFPSDLYAVTSHLRLRGVAPETAIRFATPREGEATLRTSDLESQIAEQAGELALVLIGGVNYYTGQWFALDRIAAAARRAGCVVGFDLAHAIGNVPLALHEWDVDFAVWCSYKYLNGGPGAPGGAFVHERHGNGTPPRLAGWWGHAVESRFAMRPGFVPEPGAAGWQVSTPPLLGLAPLRAALELFDRVGLAVLRRKSEALTGYLEALLEAIPGNPIRILTPAEPDARGCQLSLHLPGRAGKLHRDLRALGIVSDFRDPDVIRVAPAPFFNSFHDVWRLAQAIRVTLDRPMG